MTKFNVLRFSLVLVVSMVFVCKIQAQDSPVKWGEIPKADLEMKSYPADSNASAVVLYDYAECRVNNDLHQTMKVHRRVKILTTKGFDQATVSLRYTTKRGFERIYDIEGYTCYLDEKGETVVKELNKNDIYKNKLVDDMAEVKFTLPSLSPGCIIEYRYNMDRETVFSMPTWLFQGSEPVLWSEFRIKYPVALAYTCITRGSEPFEVQDRSESTEYVDGSLANYLQNHTVKFITNRWVVRNAPAIREEPYITTTNDYKTMVSTQLNEFAYSDGGSRKLIRTWEEYIEDMLKDKNFCGRIDDTRKMKKIAGQVTAGITAPIDQVKAIHNWVTENIQWDADNEKYSDKDVDDVVEAKKGSSADINFVLLSLLKCLKIEAYPVILSTRAHGKIQDLYPIDYQFNYVLSYVKIGTNSYLVDATSPLKPFGMLPSKVLNVKALVIKEGAPLWVVTTPTKKHSVSYNVQMTISDDGSLSGTIQDTLKDYAAYFTRDNLSSSAVKEVAKGLVDMDNFTTDSISVVNKDSVSLPLVVSLQASSSLYTQVAGDFIYINPQIVERIKTNPFKARTRNYPMDFAYPRETQAVIKLTIPEGYAVKTNVNERELRSVNDFINFNRSVKTDGRTITITTKLAIKPVVIEAQFYPRIKDFYNRVSSIMNDQIVLEKIKAPAPVTTQEVKPIEKTEAAPVTNEAPKTKANTSIQKKGKK
ncbi:MAG: DUF3857 and transglutaminase domain-containing protein [Ignavibacteria bacterium]|nr:DUF3857 and transglutaminase domain-containing protein [Ignavibacteria bacterium]